MMIISVCMIYDVYMYIYIYIYIYIYTHTHTHHKLLASHQRAPPLAAQTISRVTDGAVVVLQSVNDDMIIMTVVVV